MRSKCPVCDAETTIKGGLRLWHVFAGLAALLAFLFFKALHDEKVEKQKRGADYLIKENQRRAADAWYGVKH